MKKINININTLVIIGVIILFFIFVIFLSGSKKNDRTTESATDNYTSNTTSTTSEESYSEFRNEFLPLYSIMTYTNNTLNNLDGAIANNIRLLQIAMQIAKNSGTSQNYVGGNVAFSQNVIHHIIEELTGTPVTEVLKTNDVYFKYDDVTKQYYYYNNEYTNSLEALITDILHVEEKDNEYTIEYICYYPTEEQKQNNDFDDLEKYTNTISLKQNDTYTYCKYAITNINREANADSYYLIKNEQEQYGVMNGNGETIIEPSYMNIIIPQNSIKLFLVQNEDESFRVMGDTKYISALSGYSSLAAIKSTSGSNNFWYEKNVLTYKEGDKVGVTTFDGHNIISPNYDKIEGFGYIPERLLLKQNDRYGLADTSGKIIADTIYTKIDVKREDTQTLIYGYDEENKQILIEKVENDDVSEEYYPEHIKDWKVYTKIIYYYN